MRSYLDLLQHVLDHGRPMPSRAVLKSTGQKVGTLSLFGETWRHDLNAGMPVLSTKAVHWKSVAVELAWFLRGDCSTKFLEDHGVTIWREWASKLGRIKYAYPYHWRTWGSEYDGIGGVDQIAELIAGIREAAADPSASVRRRLILTAWNPDTIPLCPLPACHWGLQCDVRDGRLSCMVHMRSCDLFLGFPFNFASYALLTHLLAHETGLGVGDLIFTFGDLHIYDNHVQAVRTQLAREPYPLPTLRIEPGCSVERFADDPLRWVALENYRHHGKIPGEVAI